MASDGLLPLPFRDNIFFKGRFTHNLFGYFTSFFSFVKVNTLLVLTLQSQDTVIIYNLGVPKESGFPLLHLALNQDSRYHDNQPKTGSSNQLVS